MLGQTFIMVHLSNSSLSGWGKGNHGETRRCLQREKEKDVANQESEVSGICIIEIYADVPIHAHLHKFLEALFVRLLPM